MSVRTLCVGAAAVMGVAAVFNGLFMLAAPRAWYASFPGETTTGPFNHH